MPHHRSRRVPPPSKPPRAARRVLTRRAPGRSCSPPLLHPTTHPLGNSFLSPCPPAASPSSPAPSSALVRFLQSGCEHLHHLFLPVSVADLTLPTFVD